MAAEAVASQQDRQRMPEAFVGGSFRTISEKRVIARVFIQEKEIEMSKPIYFAISETGHADQFYVTAHRGDPAGALHTVLAWLRPCICSTDCRHQLTLTEAALAAYASVLEQEHELDLLRELALS